jgi:hypothetical protein
LDLAITQDARLEEGMSRRVLGHIQLEQQDWDAAARSLSQSLEILTELDSEYEVAKTRYSLALLNMTRPQSQRETITPSPLDQAIAIFEKLGAQADLTEAVALKARLAG